MPYEIIILKVKPKLNPEITRYLKPQKNSGFPKFFCKLMMLRKFELFKFYCCACGGITFCFTKCKFFFTISARNCEHFICCFFKARRFIEHRKKTQKNPQCEDFFASRQTVKTISILQLHQPR